VQELVYLHPVAMVAVLSLGLFVLREGLRIRRGRLLRRPVDTRRHRRLARILVVLAALGFGSGLASLGWLRGKHVFESVHAWLATGALVGFCAGGALGLALERRGRGPLRTWHALTASAGLLLGLAAAMAGFAILP
jgi:hypothetical protein